MTQPPLEHPEIEMIADARDIVGESIVWDARRDTLFWVDLVGRRIHMLALSSGRHTVRTMPTLVTSLGLTEDERLVVGTDKQVGLWHPDADFTPLATIEPEIPDTRLNEGVVAPDGSFWVGTMETNVHADGSPRETSGVPRGLLYRVDAQGHVSRLSPDTFGIPNTMAWRSDGQFLIADTAANTIYAYPFSSRSGSLGTRRTLVNDLSPGLPDGSCLDSEGGLWNCRVTGGALARIAPDGTLDRLIALPCGWPTSCAFGGPNLDRLYVTSARFAQSAEKLAKTPRAGAVLAFDPGVKGVSPHRFAC